MDWRVFFKILFQNLSNFVLITHSINSFERNGLPLNEPIIIKKSDAKQRKKEYISLIKKLDKSNEKVYMKNKRLLENQIKGAEGESEVDYYLRFLPEHHYILHNIKLVVKDLSAQIDHLVISPKGIFLIETKNWNANIRVDNLSNWYIDTQDGEKGVYNPYDQSRRHAEIIKRLIASVSPNIDSRKFAFFHIIALAKISAVLDSSSTSDEIILKADGIIRHIMDLSNELDDIFSISECKDLANVFMEHDKSYFDPLNDCKISKNDFIKPFKFSNEIIINTPLDFITQADNYWQDALKLVRNGELKQWFLSHGESTLANELDNCSSEYGIDYKLEKFLQTNSCKRLPAPTLEYCLSEELEIKGHRKNVNNFSIHIKKKGRGYALGTVTLNETVRSFMGNDSEFVIDLPTPTNRDPKLLEKNLKIIIQTNKKEIIPVTIKYPICRETFAKQVISFSLLIGACFTLGLLLNYLFFLDLIGVLLTIVPIIGISIFYSLKFLKIRNNFIKLFLISIIFIAGSQGATYIYPFVVHIYKPFFELRLDELAKQIIMITTYKHYIYAFIFATLIGVLILGLPKAIRYTPYDRFKLAPVFLGLFLAIIPYFTIDSVKENTLAISAYETLFDENHANAFSNDVTDTLIQTEPFTVYKVFEEDIGPEVIFMNISDMNKYGISENQTIQVHGTNLSFKARSHDRTDPGVTRMQLSVRNAVGKEAGEDITFAIEVE